MVHDDRLHFSRSILFGWETHSAMEGANKRMNVEAWATNPAIHKASKRMKRVEYGELEMILPEMSLGKMAASASASALRNPWRPPRNLVDINEWPEKLVERACEFWGEAAVRKQLRFSAYVTIDADTQVPSAGGCTAFSVASSAPKRPCGSWR